MCFRCCAAHRWYARGVKSSVISCMGLCWVSDGSQRPCPLTQQFAFRPTFHVPPPESGSLYWVPLVPRGHVRTCRHACFLCLCLRSWLSVSACETVRETLMTSAGVPGTSDDAGARLQARLISHEDMHARYNEFTTQPAMQPALCPAVRAFFSSASSRRSRRALPCVSRSALSACQP